MYDFDVLNCAYFHYCFVITRRGAAVTATHTTPVSRTNRSGEQAAADWTKRRRRPVRTWPIRTGYSRPEVAVVVGLTCSPSLRTCSIVHRHCAPVPSGSTILRPADARTLPSALTPRSNSPPIAHMCRRFPGMKLCLIESGCDNAAATFSPKLADLTIQGHGR